MALGNSHAIKRFRDEVCRLWRRALVALGAIQPFLASTILYGSGSVTVTSLGGSAAAEAAEAAVGCRIGWRGRLYLRRRTSRDHTLAVVAGVIQGINVFTAAEIPSQLQSDLSAAQNYDVGSAINASDAATSTAAKQELYGNFLEMTIPDYPSTDTVPAPQPSDPQLLVQHNPTSSIQYTAWDGSHHAARLSGGWWVDTDANGKTPKPAGELNRVELLWLAWALCQ